MYVYIHPYISQLYLPKEFRSNDTSVGMSPPTAQTFMFNVIPSPHKRNEGSLEKQLIPTWGQVRYKMSLKYLVIPESKEVFKKTIEACHQNTGARLKVSPLVKTGTIWKIK